MAKEAKYKIYNGTSWEELTFTPSNHNHDDEYLPLTGGTVTGDLNVGHESWGTTVEYSGIRIGGVFGDEDGCAAFGRNDEGVPIIVTNHMRNSDFGDNGYILALADSAADNGWEGEYYYYTFPKVNGTVLVRDEENVYIDLGNWVGFRITSGSMIGFCDEGSPCFVNTNGRYITIATDDIDGNYNTYTFPEKNGTVALLDDIELAKENATIDAVTYIEGVLDDHFCLKTEAEALFAQANNYADEMADGVANYADSQFFEIREGTTVVGKAKQLENATSFTLRGMALSTTESFDGTNNVTLWVTDIFESGLRWGGRNLAGSISPLDAAISSSHSANRLAFANPDSITVEYSNDGGLTWLDYEASDIKKVGFVSDTPETFYIGKKINTQATTDDMLRITLNASVMGVYAHVKKLLLEYSSYGTSGGKVKVELATMENPTSFMDHTEYPLNGWTGWNSLPFNTLFGGYDTQLDHIGVIRLTISITSVGGSLGCASVSRLLMIAPDAWMTPSNLAKYGHLYSWDGGQSMYLPNSLYPKQNNFGSIGWSTSRWHDVYTTNLDATYIWENGELLEEKYASRGDITRVETKVDTRKGNNLYIDDNNTETILQYFDHFVKKPDPNTEMAEGIYAEDIYWSRSSNSTKSIVNMFNNLSAMNITMAPPDYTGTEQYLMVTTIKDYIDERVAGVSGVDLNDYLKKASAATYNIVPDLYAEQIKCASTGTYKDTTIFDYVRYNRHGETIPIGDDNDSSNQWRGISIKDYIDGQIIDNIAARKAKVFAASGRTTISKNAAQSLAIVTENANEGMIIVRVVCSATTIVGISNVTTASSSGFLVSKSLAAGTHYLKIMFNKTSEGNYAWDINGDIGWTSDTTYCQLRNYVATSGATVSMTIVPHTR